MIFEIATIVSGICFLIYYFSVPADNPSGYLDGHTIFGMVVVSLIPVLNVIVAGGVLWHFKIMGRK